ncbi:hypothetical protein [Streptomyces sp. NPDC002851]
MSGEETHEGGAQRRRPGLVAGAVAAAVLLAGGGGTYLAVNAAGDGDTTRAGEPVENGGDGTPPPLTLDDGSSGSGAGDGSNGDGSPGIAPGEPDPSGARYRAEGELPDGPDSAPVYRPRGEISAARVAELAEAFGLSGKARTEGTSWAVGRLGDGPVLRVGKEAPGTWSFQAYTPGTDNCPRNKPCQSGSIGLDGTGPVSEQAAKAAAAPVLKALGQDDAKVDASRTQGAVRVVNADPKVGGLPTHDWATRLQVGSDGQLVGGNGHLAEPVKGATYPVLGAKETLDLLNKSRGQDSGAAVVPVRGAVFGLAVEYEKGRPVLVPSWLFETRPTGPQGPTTVAHPAVDPALVTEPSERPTPSPTSPPDDGATDGRDVKIESYSVAGRTLTLRFWGGVCHTYEASAKETADRVEVRVTERPLKKEQVCVAIAKELTATVTLEKPLGDRAVYGTNGAVLTRE